MRKRPLGKSGLEVSAIGVGCTGLSFKENLGATRVELTGDELNEIGEAAARIHVKGARGTGHEKHA